ncbi:MAG: DUF3467 domain-containing protein [Candidatus Acidiferrales bacterium]
MAAEQEKKSGNPIRTEGIPSLYANVASLTMGFHDVRIYFAEASPKEVTTEATEVRAVESFVVPRLCVVTNPEFARNLRDALIDSIKKYETQFGQLRPNPITPTDKK